MNTDKLRAAVLAATRTAILEEQEQGALLEAVTAFLLEGRELDVEARPAMNWDASRKAFEDWQAERGADLPEHARREGDVFGPSLTYPEVAAEEAGAEPVESDLQRAARELRERNVLPLRDDAGDVIPGAAAAACAHCGKGPPAFCRDCYAGDTRVTQSGTSHKAPAGYALVATVWATIGEAVPGDDAFTVEPGAGTQPGYLSLSFQVGRFEAEGCDFFVLERPASEAAGVLRVYVYKGLA